MDIHRRQEQFEKYISIKGKIWQALGGTILSNLYMQELETENPVNGPDSLGQFHEQSQFQLFSNALQAYNK